MENKLIEASHMYTYITIVDLVGSNKELHAGVIRCDNELTEASDVLEEFNRGKSQHKQGKIVPLFYFIDKKDTQTGIRTFNHEMYKKLGIRIPDLYKMDRSMLERNVLSCLLYYNAYTIYIDYLESIPIPLGRGSKLKKRRKKLRTMLRLMLRLLQRDDGSAYDITIFNTIVSTSNQTKTK